MVSPDGKIVDCASSGSGVLGLAAASSSTYDCSQKLKNAGYLKLEEAGAIGIKLSFDGSMRIIKVVSNSQADRACIKPNDKLVKVNNVEVTNNKDAQQLLFGKKFESVSITIDHNGTVKRYKLSRDRYTDVYGDNP